MVNVELVYMGKPTERTKLTADELKELLTTTVGCVGVEVWDFAGTTLKGLTLKLKDGRYVFLDEENNPSWEGSSEGWINVSIYDEGKYQEYLEWCKKESLKYGHS